VPRLPTGRYFVDTNALAACVEAGIDEAFIKELAKRKPLRAVFRDTGDALSPGAAGRGGRGPGERLAEEDTLRSENAEVRPFVVHSFRT